MCQLQYIDEIGKSNNWFNDKQQYLIRKIRYFRKKIIITFHNNHDPNILLKLSNNEINPGDIVRVRSVAYIKSTLDRFNKTNGCTFQKGMYNHCEKEFRVFKRVDFFYDEAKQKMCKCKNIFLLEGSCCDGTTAYLRPCSRNCFFFWHRNWLEKIQ